MKKALIVAAKVVLGVEGTVRIINDSKLAAEMLAKALIDVDDEFTEGQGNNYKVNLDNGEVYFERYEGESPKIIIIPYVKFGMITNRVEIIFE